MHQVKVSNFPDNEYQRRWSDKYRHMRGIICVPLFDGVFFFCLCFMVPGELRLNGDHTVTEYEMSGEPYSQKSGWKKSFKWADFTGNDLQPVMANIPQSLIGDWTHIVVPDLKGVRATPHPPPRYQISYENEIIWSQWDQIISFHEIFKIN